jgi:hypothetical protein
LNPDLIHPTQYSIECYDIDPKYKDITTKRDTLLNPPDYANKVVITNPPYLAKNKSKDKNLFDLYQVNDLYKCFIQTILQNPPLGGMMIIPLNFWCSIREMDVNLRKRFLEKFNIHLVNVFEENVFEDTSYTVCSIMFFKKSVSSIQLSSVPMVFYPSKMEFIFDLNKNNNYTIGGEIYLLPNKSKFKVYRLLEGQVSNSKILLKALDDDSKNKIQLSISDDPYYGKHTSRTYASINIEPPIPLEKQKEIVQKFNEKIESEREKYNSMFLTNFRESKDISRKRISFDLCYQIIHHLLS